MEKSLEIFLNEESRPDLKLKKAIDDKHPLHYLYLELIEKTKWAPIETKVNERIKIIRYSSEDAYFCPVCGQPRAWNDSITDFNSTCKNRDEQHKAFINNFRYKSVQKTIMNNYGVANVFELDKIQDKIKQTNLEKYGVTNPMSNIGVQNKFKRTNLERYGAKHHWANKEIQKKIKHTLLKNYGVEHPGQSPEIREQIKNTNLERYGYEHPWAAPEVREQIKRTNLERYGTEHPWAAPEVRERIKETNLLKYGFENPFQSPEVQEQIKRTNLLKYGTEYPSSVLGKVTSQLPTEGKTEYLKENYLDEKNQVNTRKLCKDTGCSKLYPTRLFRKYNIDFKPRSGSSAYEDHVVDYLKILDPRTEIVRNSRKIIGPLELDIYLPEYNLAIEINGSAFHSEGESTYSALHRPDSDPERHRRKLKACLEKGIDLVQAFNEVATFEQLAFEKLLAYKMGKLKWPTNQRWYPPVIKHDLLNGWPDHLIEIGYEIQEVLPPVAHEFMLGKDPRKYYDVGYLMLENIRKC